MQRSEYSMYLETLLSPSYAEAWPGSGSSWTEMATVLTREDSPE